MLSESLTWRESYRPDNIKEEDLVEVAATKKIFQRGFDVHKRPGMAYNGITHLYSGVHDTSSRKQHRLSKKYTIGSTHTRASN
jgi:hypothetical protein